MEKTLLILGIACIITAIVGGGFSGFGLKFPVFNSLIRQILLGLLGLVLVIVSQTIDREKPDPPDLTERYLEMSYHQRGGNFAIIGPNPEGVFAQQNHWWNEMDIVIENKCDERIYIEPGHFRLNLSSSQSVASAGGYRPTRSGMEYQQDRLSGGWFEPGDRVSGRLIFEVRVSPDELSGIRGQYRIIRYRGQPSCIIEYKPY